MSSFVLGDDVEGDDHLAALMDTSSTTDLHRPLSDSNDAEKEAEAALDSILETSVAEVNLALSHDDAVTAAVNAAALDATNAPSVLVDEVAVTAAAAVAASDAADAMKDTLDAHNNVTSETLLMNDSGLVDTMATNGDVGTVTAANIGPPPPQLPAQPSRAGRWSLDEKILFLFGLQKFGKGHWKKISMYVPDRSLVQIKSHAQKVLKRINSGENVFRRLEENVSRLHTLVTQIHAQLNLDPPTVLLQPTTFLSYNGLGDLGGNVSVVVAPDKKKKTETNDEVVEADASQRKRPRNNSKPSKNGTEHIAASALCQLAGPEDEENEDGTENVNEPSNSIDIGDGSMKADDDIDIGELISI